jgi:hypothetical protein
VSPAEKVEAALEVIDRALEASTEDLEAKLSGLELAFGQGFAEGVRTALGEIRKVLEP